jgi:hypothetical protein
LKAKPPRVRIDLVGVRDEVFTRVKEKRDIVREEGGPELKVRGVPLAVRIPALGDAAFAGRELRPRAKANLSITTPHARYKGRLQEIFEVRSSSQFPCQFLHSDKSPLFGPGVF